MLNKNYLTALSELTEHFQQNGQISLRDIVDPAVFADWKTPSVSESVNLLTHKYKIGSWNSQIKQLITNDVFAEFLKQLIGKEYTIQETQYLELGHGDYILRHECSPGIMFILDVGAELGHGGDFGFATEDGTAIIPSAPNTLSLLHVDEATEQFCTYITHHANNKKRKVYLGMIFNNL